MCHARKVAKTLVGYGYKVDPTSGNGFFWSVTPPKGYRFRDIQFTKPGSALFRRFESIAAFEGELLNLREI